MPLTTIQSGMMDSVAQYYGFKNRIINPAMVIDQRNAGASVSIGAGAGVITDRFFVAITQGSGHTAQRSTVAPAGFANSLLVTVGTGASPTAGQVSRVYQGIEGFNVSDLGWGTANAQTVTLSFWVRSSLTGTFAGGVYNGASNRTRVFTYAISAANTWEQKTITIPGDTTGTWATDNTAGMYVNWDLGSGSDWQTTADTWTTGADWATSGSVKLAATSGATFYITGVQLEKGSTATSFDYRPYGTELQLAQRYYQRLAGTDTTLAVAGRWAASTIAFTLPTPVALRAQPTITSSGTFTVVGNALTESFTAPAFGSWSNATVTLIKAGLTNNPSTSTAYYVYVPGSGSNYVDFSSEL